MWTRRTFAAAAASPLLAQVPETGFRPLISGSGLSGWTVEQGPESAFAAADGEIRVTAAGNSPAWLRSAGSYENFDFRGEFFVRGWIDSGIYLHAPRWGNAMDAGLCVKLFHKQEEPKPEGMGAIFPVLAPSAVNVKSRGEWNDFRIVMEWPRIQVWTNGERVQDVDLDTHPELRWRRRDGYFGLQTLGYPIRFRNLRVKQLPGRTKWETLYEGAGDLPGNWTVEEGKAKWEEIGGVLRADGLGHLATKERYKDFALEMYVRASRHSNGGVLFRAEGSGAKPHYEIQLHDVQVAVYPTGSLYGLARARYPRIAAEEWYPLQLFVEGTRCVVRVNGETVVDYGKLDRLGEGHILLQAHQAGKWIEYADIRVRRL
jgi:hypothetical protein